MDSNKQFFRPDKTQVSKFHFYSLGIVAENKALTSNVIEVTPTEELTMLDGELNADTVDVKSTGQDVSGNTYSTNVKTGNTIQATWLKLSVGNRLTSPDVRRGAFVSIYQFGDSDTFYWTTMKDDSQLRKLETVIWGFSGTKDEGAKNDPSNMYYFEVSTHTGLVAFHTSKANGEFCMYDVQINAKKGQVTITDDVGNWFLLDSDAHKIHMENTEGSIIDITKEIATIFTKDQVNIETQTMNFKATTGNYNIDTFNIQGNQLNIQESTTQVNSDSISTTGSSVSMTSPDMNFTGSATFTGLAFIVISPEIVLG